MEGREAGEGRRDRFGGGPEVISRRGGYRTAGDVYGDGDGKAHVVPEPHPGRGYDKSRQGPEEWTGPKGRYR